ncbi:MAG: phytase [Paludibaculum sp.]
MARFLALWLGIFGFHSTDEIAVRASRYTASVYAEASDAAIWVNDADPSRSLIIATDKAPSPHGALAVFTLDGKKTRSLAPYDRLGDVDIVYGVRWGGSKVMWRSALSGRLVRYAFLSSSARAPLLSIIPG